MKAGNVAFKVSEVIENKFSASYHHHRACMHYEVRPKLKVAEGCKTKFCQFDEAHKDFVYTQDWVDFLIKKLSENDEYNKIFG